jgi:hypothetical protein
VAYGHLHHLEKERIHKLHELISCHEKRLGSLEGDEGQYHEAHSDLVRSKSVLSTLLSETTSEKEERYAELYESMVKNHDQGLSDLDFSQTGL